MKVLDTKTISSPVDGEYLLQLEDWSSDYPTIHSTADQLAAYPIAKQSAFNPHGAYPQRGKRFRLGMHFSDEMEAQKAMEALESGSKTLKDFVEKFDATPNLSREQICDCL